MPGAFIGFLALALDVEHLVFVPWIKPREIFSKHIEQSAWGGSVLTMALSVCKSNHVILLLEALIAFLNSGLCDQDWDLTLDFFSGLISYHTFTC